MEGQAPTSKRYKLIKTLGKGSFSKVKEAVHLITGELVAIKVLDKAMITNNEDIIRIKREIKILMTACHPNIVSLYEIMETEKYYFFVMEHASGGELSKYICDRIKLDEKEACRLFRQLIRGVEYLHSFGCAHRDIKPSNILLKENLDLKLIDFGLGNFYSGGQQLETPCGSPCYAAPELVTGQSYNGISVDIWSSGITLFAMVCGTLPFNEDSRKELFRKISTCEYEMPDEISSKVKDLIRRILVPDPFNRISIEEIKKHPWFNLIKEDATIEKMLDDYATSEDIMYLTSKMMSVSIDKLRVMVKENSSNKFTCCYKLYMLKRQHRRLTKEDLLCIKSRRISDGSTDVVVNKDIHTYAADVERAGNIKSGTGTPKSQVYTNQKEKENAILNELLANGALKRIFVDRGGKESKGRSEYDDSRSASHDRPAPKARGDVSIDVKRSREEAYGLPTSRDPTPQITPTHLKTIGFDDDKQSQQPSRQMIRIGSQKTSGQVAKVTLNNWRLSQSPKEVVGVGPGLARPQNGRVASREKIKLMINTTWDGGDTGKAISRTSVERHNRSTSLSKDEPTPKEGVSQERPLSNIKSMIKHIMSSSRASSEDKSPDKAKFFKNSQPLRLKISSRERSPEATATPAGNTKYLNLANRTFRGLPTPKQTSPSQSRERDSRFSKIS